VVQYYELKARTGLLKYCSNCNLLLRGVVVKFEGDRELFNAYLYCYNICLSHCWYFVGDVPLRLRYLRSKRVCNPSPR